MTVTPGVMPGGGPGLLGDTRARTYADKLRLFNAFAAPELAHALTLLDVHPGDAVLDAGCGTGEACATLRDSTGPSGLVVGIDLSDAHAHIAARTTRTGQAILVADATTLPFAPRSFDRLWCSNTINHVRQPVRTLTHMARVLKPEGVIALGQSAFLPDMMFSWDARLEQEVTSACRQYYRDKYGLDERDLAATRNLIGILTRAGLAVDSVQTLVIERTQPLSPADEAYFLECVFHGYWGERLRPYLTDTDWQTLAASCDPAGPDYCLRRPDFHHLQTYTVVIGKLL